MLKRNGDMPTGASRVLPSKEEFDCLRQRANEGDAAAQAELRLLLDRCPELWQRVGDLAAQAQMTLIRLISEGDFLLGEAIGRKAAALRKQLAGPFPTRLELAATERVVATWLQLQRVELLAAQADGDFASATFWLKRQSQADRLHQSAMRSLALIRKLLPPDVPPVLGVISGDEEERGRGAVGIKGHRWGDGKQPPRGNGRQLNRFAALRKDSVRQEPSPV